MSITDYISIEETKLHLGSVTIERPCSREEALHEALVLLPDSSPREIAGYARAMNAAARLTALERAVREAERELKAAMAELRKQIGKGWKAVEIPDATKGVLCVW